MCAQQSHQVMRSLLTLSPRNSVESILRAPDTPGQQLQWIFKRERERGGRETEGKRKKEGGSSKELVFHPLVVPREQ